LFINHYVSRDGPSLVLRRAIPQNVVVYKQGDDGESPKFKKIVTSNGAWRLRLASRLGVQLFHEAATDRVLIFGFSKKSRLHVVI
jgi:hypothetical protein